jgi:hypothetical protein
VNAFPSPYDIVTRLRDVFHNDRSVELMNREAADEIERLRAELQNAYERTKTLTAERDKARREVCRLVYQWGLPTADYARSRGWDCFKEDGNA